MPEWTTATHPLIESLQAQLRAEQDTNLLLNESLADLQLALEDRGWQTVSEQVGRDFRPEVRTALTDLCTSMSIANPLIKRGVLVRTAYVWGQGVQVQARAGAEAGQDVNAVVQAFLDDNAKTLTGDVAHATLETSVATAGNVYLAAFTSPRTGAVRVRQVLDSEVKDVICNPQDRDDPWYYIRHVPQRVVEPGQGGNTRTRNQVVKVAHPALSYRPRQRPRSIDGMPVQWDAPILHVPVNRPHGWRFGIPDVYAAIAWARAYKDFLVDWAQLTKALSKYAWQVTGGTKGKAQAAAAKIREQQAAAQTPAVPGVTPSVAAGSTVVNADARLEAVSRSGATIDADSGKPLAGMAAAGMGLPVTLLLADPGITGARAVAETLDLPTILEMGMRRLLWQAAFTELLDYVIDQAVIAPAGPLRGVLGRDEWDRMQVVLAGEVERTLDWDWPPLADMDPVDLVKAVVEADSTGIMPGPTTLRLLLAALGVKDADEVLAEMTDEQGRFVDPRVTAGQVAVDAFRDGQDPAAALA